MGKIEARDGDVFAQDVVPNVQLRPVVEWEYTEVLTRLVLAVVQVPEFRSLVLGIPLAEVVAVAEKALFGTGLLLVPSRSAATSVEPVGLDCRNEGGRLDLVA